MPTIFRRTHHILLADIYPHEISQTTRIYKCCYWGKPNNKPSRIGVYEIGYTPVTGMMHSICPLWSFMVGYWDCLWHWRYFIIDANSSYTVCLGSFIDFFPITISYPMNINESDCWLLKQTKQTQHIQSLFPTKPHQSIVIVLWIVLFVSWLCSMISMMNSHSPTRNRNGTYWESLALLLKNPWLDQV